MIEVYYLNVVLPVARDAARACGYALGLHGSLKRDLDLVAVPWTPQARHPQELAESVRKAVGGYYKPGAEDAPFFWRGMPGYKPHGRLVWSFHFGGRAYVDLSVVRPWAAEPDPVYCVCEDRDPAACLAALCRRVGRVPDGRDCPCACHSPGGPPGCGTT